MVAIDKGELEVSKMLKSVILCIYFEFSVNPAPSLEPLTPL